MTIYEEIKEVSKNRKIVTTTEIREELNTKFGRNSQSVLLSDYCYNRTNNGINFDKHVHFFLYIKRNTYEYVGEGYKYTGKIYHKSQHKQKIREFGEWINGNLIIYKTEN